MIPRGFATHLLSQSVNSGRSKNYAKNGTSNKIDGLWTRELFQASRDSIAKRIGYFYRVICGPSSLRGPFQSTKCFSSSLGKSIKCPLR